MLNSSFPRSSVMSKLSIFLILGAELSLTVETILEV
jgi:hypothetical protein